MNITFQYNKISLQQIENALRIRYAALPVIRSKEAALRIAVKRCKNELLWLHNQLNDIYSEAKKYQPLFVEWPEFRLSVKEVVTHTDIFAGVKYPVFKDLHFNEISAPVTYFSTWFPQGSILLKKGVECQLRIQVKEKECSLLESERKRTTQKLNLYEKMQIPAYEEAKRKIKGFLEDEENLNMATQKLVKTRKKRQ